MWSEAANAIGPREWPNDPAADGALGMRSGLPGVQIDAFIFRGPPQAFSEDVVDATPLAIPQDLGADPLRRSVQAQDMHREPWSVFMIPGAP